MLKSLATVFCLLLTTSSFALNLSCPQASTSGNSEFCSSFKRTAQCYCTSAGLPAGMCNDMGVIYKRMVTLYGSVERACKFQRQTSTQECLDDWHCYRSGGRNSGNELCSGTGNSCE